MVSDVSWEVKVAGLVQSPSLNSVPPSSSSLCSEFSFDVVLDKTPDNKCLLSMSKPFGKHPNSLIKSRQACPYFSAALEQKAGL